MKQTISCPQPAPGPAARDGRVPLFAVRGLTRIYPTPAGPVVALNGVNVDIGHGITGVLGPSGQGKSTLFHCLGGLDRPTSGEVFFHGGPVLFEDEAFLRRFRSSQVAWVFQELNLVPHLTVVENVALARSCQGWGRRASLKEAVEMLGLLEAAELAGRRPHQLSRGQKQRVAIARACCGRAPVILADEPTASLDRPTARAVMKSLCGLTRALGKSLLLVTHDEQLAAEHCDRRLYCEAGTLSETPRKASTGTDPKPH